MFQRLKGAIDSRIAEEQARQRLSQASPSRNASNAGRSSSRNLSPSKRASRQPRGRQDAESQSKGPDPAEFEPDLVADSDEQSRSGTPRLPLDRNGSGTTEKTLQETTHDESGQGSGETTTSAEEQRTSSDLPTDVRVKLRKLEKLESRYHELLRSYRIAHARVLTIEPFETSLREATPLTSISDPKAFVEYVNQVNLKGDMVLGELKRVSNERDTFKQRLSDAERSTKEAWDEVANLRKPGLVKDVSGKAEPDANEQRSVDHTPPHSTESPTVSENGRSLVSAKPIPIDFPKVHQESDDLFSYDDEIPRLENELKERQQKIDSLESDVRNLKGDLTVTRESTQSMVQTLEEATRELNGLRDSKDASLSDLREQKLVTERVSERLRTDLQAAESRLQSLQVDRSSRDSDRIVELDTQLRAARQELEGAQRALESGVDARKEVAHLHATTDRLESTISNLRASSAQNERKIDTLNGIVTTLRSQLTDAEEKNQDLTAVIEKSSKASQVLQDRVDSFDAQNRKENPLQPDTKADQEPSKGLQSTKTESPNAEQDHDSLVVPSIESTVDASEVKESIDSEAVAELQQQLRQVRGELLEKDVAIERLHGKLKDQHGLREEIETLRDEIVNVGQEHVEAKDQVKHLLTEKIALEARVSGLEKELSELQEVQASNALGSEQKHNDLEVRFEDLKVKATTLQKDLSAAQQLAASRFKDLNDLRSILQKAQPEIDKLRHEAIEAKSFKEMLTKKDADFKRLDSRHEEMRSEVMGLKETIKQRDLEVTTLSTKLGQESSSRLKVDDAISKATQENQRLDVERRRATESLDRMSNELRRAQEDLSSTQTRLRDMERQSSKMKSDSEGFQEEIDLKTAQYSSAQSLMASMRDQTAEMAMQMKEARERCESLDEEVAEAHRLLGERTREGETMRRLLADVEGRADVRTREMKERMDLAIEERDRAEEEASTAGRRRARELEDLRNKYRDLERDLKRAGEDKEELEIQQRDWKRRREELEHRAGHSTKEVEEIRTAMSELRDALDGSEKLVRDLEKQRAELRRSVEETQQRLGKLQKSNKAMADEISKIQTARSKPMDSGAHSSRSSQDSASRLASPVPKSRTPSVALSDAPNGNAAGPMDYIYLKNVLLQFLEQKDKKHQMQLIPVLGMLLHFDRTDEQKWMRAVTTKA